MKKALQRLDSVHQKLIGTVATLEPELYSRRPAEGEWSVAEIVHHLCLVEDRVIKELEKELAAPPRKLGLLRRLVPTAIVASRLVRVKAPKSMNPIDAPSKDEGTENYNAVRNKLQQLCAMHGSQRLKQVIFKHPFLGDIDGTATISFVGYHELRHYKQIREALKKLEPVKIQPRN